MNNLCKLIITSICLLSHAIVVEYKPIPQKALLRGNLESASSTSIQLPFDAVLSPLIPFNSEVSSGDPIFKIDADSSHSMLLKVIHQYFQAANVLNIQYKHQLLQKELMTLDVISQKAYQETIMDYEIKQADFLEKELVLTQVLGYYQKSIKDVSALDSQDIMSIHRFIQTEIPNYITSPASGIFITNSDKPTGKQPVTYAKNKPVASILNRQEYELSLLVTAAQANQITKGQIVTVKIQDIDIEVEGTVSAIGAYPASLHAQREYAVTISFNTLDHQSSQPIRIGMAAAVTLQLSEKKALMIPLTFVKSGFGMSHHVMVKKLNNINMLREVTLGVTHDNEVEILTGLVAGEEIIEHH